nr:TetR/AcrR family transcriptional regulator [uncultured Pseudomonas sp.]
MKTDQQPEKRPRGRPKTRQLDRESLLENAMQLFWQRGYETTSTREITTALGITSAELYALFGDKERLYNEAIARYEANAGSYSARIFREERTARSAVERMLLEAARDMVDPNRPAGCMLVTSAMNCAPNSDHVQARISQLRLEAESRLRARIEQGIQEGDVPETADAASLASFYSAILQGLTIQARDGASAQTMAQIAKSAMLAWPS